MYSPEDVIQIAGVVKRVVNELTRPRGAVTDKIFLIGSYANGSQKEGNDLDFLVQLRGRFKFPSWNETILVRKALPDDVHVIFGTESNQLSLMQKGEVGPYRLILGA